MLENKFSDRSDAICIDVNRVYDSCCDKDCLSDLNVVFPDRAQNLIDCASSVRCKKAEIINVCIDVEPVQFNRGCYSVDLTFFIKVKMDIYSSPSCTPTTVCGLTSYSKKCILYGSDGNVKIYSSKPTDDTENGCTCRGALPTAKVQCVDPVVLDTNLVKTCDCKCCCKCDCQVPSYVSKQFDGELCGNPNTEKTVLVTLGLFCIVQLERKVQMKIPSYDFCIPSKECNCNTDDPCDSFSKIRFPLEEFFPPNQKHINKMPKNNSCSCNSCSSCNSCNSCNCKNK